MKKHPHAEFIKAWADGTPIEYSADGGESWTRWATTDVMPSFCRQWEYRVCDEVTVMYEIVSKRVSFDSCSDALLCMQEGDHLIRVVIDNDSKLIKEAEEIVFEKGDIQW
jgi:hypothetical protein